MRGLWPETRPARQELLMLPTGTGGVLYRPSYFHPIVFDENLRNLTLTGDDLLFRLATLAMGVPVVTSCSEDDTKFTCPTPKAMKEKIKAPYSKNTHTYGDFTFLKTDFNEQPVRTPCGGGLCVCVRVCVCVCVCACVLFFTK